MQNIKSVVTLTPAEVTRIITDYVEANFPGTRVTYATPEPRIEKSGGFFTGIRYYARFEGYTVGIVTEKPRSPDDK